MAVNANEHYNRAVGDVSLIACPQCDLLQRMPDRASAASARCPRCNEELWRRREDSLNRTLALAVAAAVLYAIANSVPMLGLTVVGRGASTTVIGGALHLWQAGQTTVGVLVLFTAVVAPALQIILMLAIVLGARRQPAPRWTGKLLRHQATTQTWSMIEVMILGVLVALVKIADYATVIPGIALFALGALIGVLSAMQVSFEPREVWERVQWVEVGAKDKAVELGAQPGILETE
jgi:paraquat-inducible protein A